MAQRYTAVSGAGGRRTNTSERALVQLSDGGLAFLAVNAGATDIELFVVQPGSGTVTSLGSATTGGSMNIAQPGLNSITIVTDNLDNIYVVAVDSGRDTFMVQAWTKGAGYAWTRQTAKAGGAGNSNFSLTEFAAVWANTGGGTSSKGHIVICGMHAGNPWYVVADAGVALAGAGTLQVNAGAGVPFWGGNGTYVGSSGILFDMIPATFGATSGFGLSGGYANGGNVGISFGTWAVSSGGVLTGANVSVSAGNGTLRAPSDIKARLIIPLAGITAIFSVRASDGRICVFRGVGAAAPSDPPTAPGAVADFPTFAADDYSWDVIVDPSGNGKAWVIAPKVGDHSTILGLGVDLSGGITWDTTARVLASGIGTGGTTDFIRSFQLNRLASVQHVQADNITAGTRTILGVDLLFGGQTHQMLIGG